MRFIKYMIIIHYARFELNRGRLTVTFEMEWLVYVYVSGEGKRMMIWIIILFGCCIMKIIFPNQLGLHVLTNHYHIYHTMPCLCTWFYSVQFSLFDLPSVGRFYQNYTASQDDTSFPLKAIFFEFWFGSPVFMRGTLLLPNHRSKALSIILCDCVIITLLGRVLFVVSGVV